MGTPYSRQDTSNNIADGNVIDAADLDNEFDQLEAAFNSASGHTHDGTVGEGAPIEALGPSQQISATTSAVVPKTDDLIDLGSALLEFKDLYIDGVANIDSLVADTGTVGGVAITTASNTQALTNKTINLTSNTLTATSAQLATALTDETGTGSVVFSASPALTGTPTAPTAVAATNTTQLATTAHVFAERANTATLTNKTLTGPTINTATITGGTISGITDLAVLDGGTGSSTAAGALVNLGLTATAAELNTLDGILPTVTELNYVDGVTSAIQTQLDAKALNTNATVATSISLTGAASDWKFALSGNDLVISYGGVNKAKLDTTGNLTIVGNVTAYGTI